MLRLNHLRVPLLGLALPAVFFAVSSCAGSETPSGPSSGTGGSNTGNTGNVGNGNTGNGGADNTGNVGNTGNGGSMSNPGAGGSTSLGGSSNPGAGGAPAASGGTGTSGSGTSGGTVGGGTGGASTGSGGTATAGAPTAGAGGSGPKGKLCATPATPAAALLTDFETYDGKVAASEFGFTWAPMAYGGFFPIPDGSVTPTLSILAGHAGNYGMNISAVQATAWGAAIGSWLSPSCINASAFTGITFWVRGTTPTGTFSFGIDLESTVLPDAADPAAGGTCPGTVETCKSPSVSDIPLTTDWTQVSLPWSMFIGGTSGATAVTVDGSKITGLNFNLPLKWIQDPASPAEMPTYIPEKGDVDFSFDDLAFM